jgi:hypothetical protein
MSKAGKVKVVVRSRRVPVRTVEFAPRLNYTFGAASSPVSYASAPSLNRQRAVIYESVLDDKFQRAIDEGERLACNLGLELEVIDESRLGLFRRVLSHLGRDGSGNVGVVISPSLAEHPVDTASPLVHRN